MSASSLHRESTDSLILKNVLQCCHSTNEITKNDLSQDHAHKNALVSAYGESATWNGWSQILQVELEHLEKVLGF